MPELPEVETVRKGLVKLVVRKKVIHVTHDNGKSFPNDVSSVDAFLIGARIVDVSRRAKVLLFELDTGYSLVVHLKMTGQLVFRKGAVRFGAGHPGDSLVGDLPDSTTRVVFTFEDGSVLYFNDQRKFGWVRLIPTLEVPAIDFMRRVGPEPLTKHFTWKVLERQLAQHPGMTIKAALLDQSIIAGIGNIYADESLWRAKIHPETRVAVLDQSHIRSLHRAIRAVLRLGIEKGGSTDKNYVDAEGRKGTYLAFAHVFRREGLPCSRCGTPIIKTRVAGRGTHICPFCQKLRMTRNMTDTLE